MTTIEPRENNEIKEIKEQREEGGRERHPPGTNGPTRC